MNLADEILQELRVPDLPYPVSRDLPPVDWVPRLAEHWQRHSDDTVISVLKAGTENWSMRQVNAAYLADRVMDIFLRKSGLHPELLRRVARLRFWLAWRLAEEGAAALSEVQPIRRWLDTLESLRGWSDSGGRSDRWVLERLDALHDAVTAAFSGYDPQMPTDVVESWIAERTQQAERVARLQKRLLETEKGAARQRAAEQRARAATGRVLRDRVLAPAAVHFIDRYWQPLLRQIALEQGIESEAWRHASRILEWLVWAADARLSDQDRDRLYQVGEHLVDKLGDVWQKVTGSPLSASDTEDLQALLVARLKGEEVAAHPVLPQAYDDDWLESQTLDADLEDVERQWFVEGEGTDELRRYLFAVLEDAGEILWTNGAGVKQGLEPVAHFRQALAEGRYRRLPALNPFGEVLADTLASLGKVLQAQRVQRERALAKARQQADQLRQAQAQAAAEAQQAAEDQARAEAEERKRIQLAAEAAEEAARLEAEAELDARALAEVDALKLGGWIELVEQGEKHRLKLAVRINASSKLVFVDRHGLSRRELLRQDLKARIRAGEARILSAGAEFDEALSRVVGRIRVGRT